MTISRTSTVGHDSPGRRASAYAPPSPSSSCPAACRPPHSPATSGRSPPWTHRAAATGTTFVDLEVRAGGLRRYETRPSLYLPDRGSERFAQYREEVRSTAPT